MFHSSLALLPFPYREWAWSGGGQINQSIFRNRLISHITISNVMPINLPAILKTVVKNKTKILF